MGGSVIVVGGQQVMIFTIFRLGEGSAMKDEYTVLYCDLCRRQTGHTLLTDDEYHCDNCTQGYCLIPAVPFDKEFLRTYQEDYVDNTSWSHEQKKKTLKQKRFFD
jgi:hypothetical protein